MDFPKGGGERGREKIIVIRRLLNKRRGKEENSRAQGTLQGGNGKQGPTGDTHRGQC